MRRVSDTESRSDAPICWRRATIYVLPFRGRSGSGELEAASNSTRLTDVFAPSRQYAVSEMTMKLHARVYYRRERSSHSVRYNLVRVGYVMRYPTCQDDNAQSSFLASSGDGSVLPFVSDFAAALCSALSSNSSVHAHASVNSPRASAVKTKERIHAGLYKGQRE